MVEIFFILFLFFILLSVLYYTLKLGISPMFSSFKVSTFIANEFKKSEKIFFVDLGSGWGSLAFIVAVRNPKKKVIGYELSTFPFYFSFLFKYIFGIKNLQFYKKDFLTESFYSDYIYFTYLFPKGMESLEQKLQQSKIKPLIISSTFALPKDKFFEKKVLDDMFRTPIYFYNHN
jgi:hypothetical protein